MFGERNRCWQGSLRKTYPQVFCTVPLAPSGIEYSWVELGLDETSKGLAVRTLLAVVYAVQVTDLPLQVLYHRRGSIEIGCLIRRKAPCPIWRIDSWQ